MARGSADILLRKNSKLESFLKRTLSDDTFERIRAYESCIVVSEKENKAFKYIVLGNEWIYLTENPPKAVQESVCLRDVVSVELVHDHPAFLSGEEKENTQHLAVTYWTREKRSRRRSKRSPRYGSLSDLQGDPRSNTSTPTSFVSGQESLSEDYGYITQSLSSLQVSRPNSRGSLVSVRDAKTGSISKKKKKALNDSLDENLLKSLKEEIEEDCLEGIQEDDRLSRSTPHSQGLLTSNSVTGKVSKKKGSPAVSPRRSVKPPPIVDDLELPPPTSQKEDDVTSALHNGTVEDVQPEPDSTTCGCARICFGKNKVTPSFVSCSKNSATTEQNKFNSLSSSTKSKMGPPPPGIYVEAESENKRRPSLSGSVQETAVSRQSSVTTLRGQSRAGTPLLEHEGNRSGLANASSSDLGGSMNGLSVLGETGDQPEKRKAVINIYLLNLHSPMLMLIRSSWSNYLFSSTLMMDPLFEKSSKTNVVRGTGSQTQRDKMELLFSQLKQDLFNPDNTMEDIFSLLLELRSATEKTFALKRLFWRSSDIFLFLVRQLQRYLPRSPINVNTDHGREQRADEFEFVIVLIELLSLMFRESEIIPTRAVTLKAERGKAVFDLLMVLTCCPEVPQKYVAPASGTSRLLGISKSEAKKAATDEEFAKLLLDLTKVSLMSVYELFLVARQAGWGFSDDNFFNISWMVRMLEDIRTTERFVERVIDQVMSRIGPSCTEALSPEESVTLYKQFSVIYTLLEYSPRITAFIRNNYLEEFKYFVQAPVVMKKLSMTYPITSHMVQLIEKVMDKVLAPQLSMSFNKSPR